MKSENRYALKVVAGIFGFSILFMLAWGICANAVHGLSIYLPLSAALKMLGAVIVIFLLFRRLGKITAKDVRIAINNQENTSNLNSNKQTDTNGQWKRLLLIAGIALSLYAFFMDTSVAVTNNRLFKGLGLPDRVNNLGLVADRFMYLVSGTVITIIALVLINISPKKEIVTDKKDVITQLSALNELKESGAISEDEYSKLKKQLLEKTDTIQ